MASWLKLYAIRLNCSLKGNLQLFEVWKRVVFLNYEELKCNKGTFHQVTLDQWHCIVYGSMQRLFWFFFKDLFYDVFFTPNENLLKVEWWIPLLTLPFYIEEIRKWLYVWSVCSKHLSLTLVLMILNIIDDN